MTNCHRCKTHKDRAELIGANVFDAVTGRYIITRWYCLPCANTLGLVVSNNNDRQTLNNPTENR